MTRGYVAAVGLAILAAVALTGSGLALTSGSSPLPNPLDTVFGRLTDDRPFDCGIAPSTGDAGPSPGRYSLDTTRISCRMNSSNDCVVWVGRVDGTNRVEIHGDQAQQAAAVAEIAGALDWPATLPSAVAATPSGGRWSSAGAEFTWWSDVEGILVIDAPPTLPVA